MSSEGIIAMFTRRKFMDLLILSEAVGIPESS